MSEEKAMEMPSFRSISFSLEEPRGLDLGRADPLDFSFRGFAMLEAVDRATQEGRSLDPSSDESEADFGFDFDFALVPKVSAGGFGAAGADADEIFSRGRFGSRKLVRAGDLRRSSSSESSDSGELDGVPAEIYCVWDPQSGPTSPRLRKKSCSAGTCSVRWRFLDLVGSSRSRSDGKDKFADGNSPKSLNSNKAETLAGEQKKKKSNSPNSGARISKTDLGAAHRILYVERMAVSGDRRRTFLPYRQDLLGIFANPSGSPARSLFAM